MIFLWFSYGMAWHGDGMGICGAFYSKGEDMAKKLQGTILVHFELTSFGFAYGRDRNSSFLWFLDFWTRSRAPKPILFILGGTRTLKGHQEKSLEDWTNHRFCKPQHSRHPNLWENFGKDGRRTIPVIRLIKPWKSWILHQYLPENMKWTFAIGRIQRTWYRIHWYSNCDLFLSAC